MRTHKTARGNRISKKVISLFWHIYNYIAVFALLSQLVFIVQSLRNFRFALKESKKVRVSYRPKTLLTVPCKGIDKAFEKNISSFYNLDYGNYILCFVVECEQDPAYQMLTQIKQQRGTSFKGLEVKILVAGRTDSSSQKIHNLLHSCRNADNDVEVFAFADSDICVKPHWLSHLVHPLRKSKKGATTGYRWFVPKENNSATVAATCLNAKVAQLLGNTRFNQAWGGSMAVLKKTFYAAGIDKIWQTAVSDDLCLSYAVKKQHKKVIFVPACLVASYEKFSWSGLFEFARRQFVITRVTTPGTWAFGLFSAVFAVTGVWLGLALAVTATLLTADRLPLYWSVPTLFLGGQFLRAVLREYMITKILPEEADKLKTVRCADICGNLFFSLLLLGCIISSACGNNITWRGVTYRLIGPAKTVVKKH